MRISLFLSDWIKEGKERQTSNIFLSYFLWKLFGMHELSGHFCLIVFYRAVGKEKKPSSHIFLLKKIIIKSEGKLYFIILHLNMKRCHEMTSQKILFFLYVFKTLPQLILWVIYCHLAILRFYLKYILQLILPLHFLFLIEIHIKL